MVDAPESPFGLSNNDVFKKRTQLHQKNVKNKSFFFFC